MEWWQWIFALSAIIMGLAILWFFFRKAHDKSAELLVDTVMKRKMR